MSDQLEGAKVDFAVPQYSEAFKSRMVSRLVGPAARSANAVAAEVSVPQATLSRWLLAAGNVSGIAFVRWYNTTHLHSAIRFVTPEDRHTGRDGALLAARHTVYEHAGARLPERWSGTTRNWEPIATVALNPERVAAVPQVNITA
jgi:transposase-like protein